MSDVIRILLVDDHAVLRAGLRALLDAEHDMAVVGECSTGEEGVERAARLRPDVVVMDLSMPVLDGIAATERVVRECPGVRVVALTAHDDRAHLTRLLEAGASGYILKRGAAIELVRAIRTVASGATYVDPVLAGSFLVPAARPGPTPATAADASLSEREEEVLRRFAWGESNKSIAAALGISTKTVETYRSRIAEKLGIRTRTEIVRYALRRGWLSE